MIILSATTDKLQTALAGAVAANQLQCVSSWRDRTSTTFIAGRTCVNTNGANDVDLVGSPDSSTQRIVDFVGIYNADTANATATVKLDLNGTEFILWKGVLASGERLQYTDNGGWQVFTIAGAPKVSQYLGTQTPAATTMTTVVTTEDTVNNNATLNTLKDVTGASFAVESGNVYYFEITVRYTSAATGTGSRWTLNGPANPTYLAYRSEYTLAATTTTVNTAVAYAIPAACNASSLTAGNVATLWGFIQPSQNGTVQVQFASETANVAITAKAGSIVKWQRIV